MGFHLYTQSFFMANLPSESQHRGIFLISDVSGRRIRLIKSSLYVFSASVPKSLNNLDLKGPKHDQVGYEFFYIKQTRMVR
jgi:hypothetical protein